MGVHYILDHAAGCFLLDEERGIIEACGKNEKEAFLQKHKLAQVLSYPAHKDELRKSLLMLASGASREEIRRSNLEKTKEDMRQAIGEDILIIQAIKSIADIDKTLNSLTHRLRDWYELYLPEYSNLEKDPAAFAKGVVEISKEGFSKEKGIQSFGASLSLPHINILSNFGKDILGLHKAREHLLIYLEESMKSYCPNLQTIAGTALGARLLELGGSMRRLAGLPSSTIQILGAEKALFRHLKTGSRPPKHGVLLGHDLVQSAQKKRQGRAARILADKISIAIRIDYFKGEFIGDRLLEEARKKINQ